MAEIAAPYFSPTELTQGPGNPALAGVDVAFDPAIKDPLGPLRETFGRLDAQNFSARQAEKQRQFSAGEQEKARQHNILMRNMDYDNAQKVREYQTSQQDRNALFNLFNTTGATSATLKDASGNDMAIPFLPQDAEALRSETGSFQEWAFQNPSKNLYSPELKEKMDALKQKRTNASMRTVYYSQARQALQNTYDPAERARLQKYMQQLESAPLTGDSAPAPFFAMPSTKRMIDVEKDYKEGKGFESFDNGSGVPNARYQSLLATSDPASINEGYKRFQFFRSQPEGQSPQAYVSWKENLDHLTDARGLPRINFEVAQDANGNVVFDESTYGKKQDLARKMLFASELMDSGYLRAPDEAETLDLQKKRTDIAKDLAEIAKKKAETVKEGKMTKEEREEKQTVDFVRAINTDVDKAFDTKGAKPVSEVATQWWAKNGVNASDYTIYPVSKKRAERYVGVEAPEVTEKSGDVTKKGTVTGTPTASVDNVWVLENKQTGEKQLAFAAKNKIVSIVNQKDALINGIKHEAKYDPKEYLDKITWVEGVLGSGKEGAQPQETEEVIRARLVPVTLRMKDGSLVKAMKDPVTGKRYAL